MGYVYSAVVETTSNATAGAAAWVMQWLMPASRECRLVAIYIQQAETAAGENFGRWTVDRISAVATGAAYTPLKSRSVGPASAITDTSVAISTTLACAPTAANSAICELSEGWNFFKCGDNPFGPLPEMRSGLNQGFAIRRATAPTGARVCVVQAFWEEDP